MWHEARKQERKIRGMLVDYRKRAERRRDFYEKIKADPTQFLQVHGRQSKIFLDPAIAAAADSTTTMVPWQGNQDNLIDRFDVRAHLDFIPPIQNLEDEELSLEDRQLNYERYRIVAQNSFLQIGEEKFLKQLHLEEQFGYTEQQEPKKKKTGGVAIGFNYEDGTGTSQPAPVIQQDENNEDSDDSDGSDSDLDVDLAINVSKVDSAEAHEMNRHGRNFGMSTNDFYSFLTNDLEEAENFKLAKEEENEKALFAGRKSRRERRAHREKRLANRKISPPSYAAQVSPSALNTREESNSPSHSPSPEVFEKITYITSFGGEDEPQMPLNPTYADKVKFGNNKLKKLRRDDSEERIVFEKKASGSSDRYGSRRKSVSPRRRSRSYDRSRSGRSYQRRARKSRTSSTSFSSRSRSRSRRSRSRSRRSHSSRRRHRRRDSSSASRSRGESNSDSSVVVSSRERSRSESVVRAADTAAEQLVQMEADGAAVKDVAVKQEKVESPPKVIPRYYGRRRSDRSSSSELGVTSDENGDAKMDVDENPVSSPATQRNLSSGNASTTAKGGSSGGVLSLQERLKRKRQALLNKQFKADKIAEQLKTEREKQEQQTREDELREMGIKLRRRQRERRHAYDSDNSNSSSSSSRSSKSHTNTNNSNPTSQADLSLNNRTKSRSKSPSSRSLTTNHNNSTSSSQNRNNRDVDRDKSPTKESRERNRDREKSGRRSRSRERDSSRKDRNRDRRERDERSSRLDRTDRSRDRSSRTRRLSRSRSRSRRDDGWSSRRDYRDRDGGRGNARSLVDY